MVRRCLPLFALVTLLAVAAQAPATAQDGEFCAVELTLVGDGGISFINNYFTTDVETTGDGKASPGEILHFVVKIKNTSRDRLISTSVLASCSEKKCILSLPSETSKNKPSRPGDMVLPELAPEMEVSRHFWVGVPNTVGTDGSMVVTVDVGDSDHGVVKKDLTIELAPAVATSTFKAPAIENLKFDDDRFGDSDGNGDTLPQPDERIELRLEVRNAEAMPLIGVEVMVRSSHIEFSEDRKNFDELPAAAEGVQGMRLDFAGKVLNLPEGVRFLPIEITVLGKLNNTDSSWTYGALLSVIDRNVPPKLTPGMLETLGHYVDAGGALHALHAWGRTYNLLNNYEFEAVLDAERNALVRQGGDPALLSGLEALLKAERDAMAKTGVTELELQTHRHMHQMFAMGAFGQKAQWGGILSSPDYVRSVDPFGLEGLSEVGTEAVARKGLRWTPRGAHLLLATLYGNDGWQAIPIPKTLETHSYVKEALAASIGASVQPNVLVRAGEDSVIATVFISRGIGALGAATLKVMFLCSQDYSQCRLLFTHARDYAVKVRKP